MENDTEIKSGLVCACCFEELFGHSLDVELADGEYMTVLVADRIEKFLSSNVLVETDEDEEHELSYYRDLFGNTCCCRFCCAHDELIQFEYYEKKDLTLIPA